MKAAAPVRKQCWTSSRGGSPLDVTIKRGPSPGTPNRSTPSGHHARGATPSGDGSRGARPTSQQSARPSSQQAARPASVQGGRPSSVPLSSSPTGSRKDMKLPLERMLDHRLHSISTFVSSTHSTQNDMLAGKSGESGAQWSEEMPSVILFPANRLCSRADAIVLNQWVTNALARYADKISQSREQDGNLSQMVDELVPILSIGLHEVVRQVNQHCLERGVVLEKIWRTYVELFERLLAETRVMLRFHRDRTQQVQAERERTERELSHVQRRHPEQIEKLSKTLLSKFSRRQEELEQQLEHAKYENSVLTKALQEHTSSVSSWFPRFDTYKNSSFRISLLAASAFIPSSTTPEARLASDFRRIVTAMPHEARRRVGFFVSSLLGLRSSELTDETVESLTEQRDHNAWQIERLQTRIQELRDELRPSSPESPMGGG